MRPNHSIRLGFEAGIPSDAPRSQSSAGDSTSSSSSTNNLIVAGNPHNNTPGQTFHDDAVASELFERANALASREDELVRELKAIRMSLYQARVELANRCAPVSRLPYEILAKTFEIVCGSSQESFHLRKTNSSGRKEELVLSQVSRQWRHVAVSTGSLWTNIRLRCDKQALSHALGLLDLYLLRSKGCPIDVTVHAPNARSYTLQPVACALSKHVERWRNIVLDICTDSDVTSILQPLKTSSAPHLESVLIHGISGREEDAALMIHAAPRLQTLTLDNICVGIFSHLPDTLTSLRICSSPWSILTLEKLHGIVSSLPHLSNLTLAGEPIVLPTQFEQRLPLASSLRTMSVQPHHAAAMTYLWRLFEHLEVPSIEELELRLALGASLPNLSAQYFPILKRLTLCLLENRRPMDVAQPMNLPLAYPCAALKLHLARSECMLEATFARPKGKSTLMPPTMDETTALEFLLVRAPSVSDVDALLHTLTLTRPENVAVNVEPGCLFSHGTSAFSTLRTYGLATKEQVAQWANRSIQFIEQYYWH